MTEQTCCVYSTHLGMVRITDPVSEYYARAFSWERKRFHDGLLAWLETAIDAGSSIDRVIIRLSQWKKWTGQ